MRQRLVLIYVLMYFVKYTNSFGNSDNFTHPDFIKWTPSGSRRDDLFCPVSCAYDEECCSCHAVTCWEIDAFTCNVWINYFHVEYSDIIGSSNIIAEVDNATVYELVHTPGHMTSLPKNLCDWNSTTFIDLCHNRLQTISTIKCLWNLYVLKLDFNRIQNIPNNTFTNFRFLRVLSISNNKLRYLDPNTIKIKNGNIHSFSASFNDFISVDVTNVLSKNTFCIMDYHGSYMRNITNALDFSIGDDEEGGPGSINFTYTKSFQFFNFSTIGMSYNDAFDHMDGCKFHFDESSMKCDCNLYPLFDNLGVRTYDIWPNLLSDNFTCVSPEHMEGKSLKDILDSKTFEVLTCDLTEYCPYKCKCTDRPSNNVVTVNCTGAGLTELPDYMPIGHWNNYKLDLHLEGNSIQTIHNRNYINRIANLYMNANPVSDFPQHVAENFEELESLSMDSYRGSAIPVVFQKQNPKLMHFGDNIITCDCSNLWIGRWLRSYNVLDGWNCYVHGKVVPVREVDEYYLQCNESDELSPFIVVALFISALASLLITMLIGYYFRFEIILLKRRYFQTKQNQNSSEKSLDVFISFNEENDDVASFIINHVRKRLLDLGYSVYIPLFDNWPGANEELQINTALNDTFNYVVFLCEKYNSSKKCQSEFERIWAKYIADSQTNMIIVNFDALKSKHLFNRPLRAGLLVGKVLDFATREDRLIDRLTSQLNPLHKTRIPNHEYNIENEENVNQNNLEVAAEQTHNSRNNNVELDDETRFQCVRRGTKHVPVTENVYDRRSSASAEKFVRQKQDRKKAADSGTCNRKYRRCYLTNTDNPWTRTPKRNVHNMNDIVVYVDIETNI